MEFHKVLWYSTYRSVHNSIEQGNSNYMLWQCTGFEGSNFIEIQTCVNSENGLRSHLWL